MSSALIAKIKRRLEFNSEYEADEDLIKDFIESTFPNITYKDAKQVFDSMYCDYERIRNEETSTVSVPQERV